MKIHQHCAGHMTKMAAMPIYGINTFKILFPGTTRQILMKLCMKHQIPKPFIICANHDHGLTLTIGFCMGKCDNYGFFGNYCIL